MEASLNSVVALREASLRINIQPRILKYIYTFYKLYANAPEKKQGLQHL